METKALEGFDTDQKFGGSGLHIALQRASGAKPYLGSTDVVAGLVRPFLAGVADRVADVGSGTLDKGTAALADIKACTSLARIFLGEDPTYESVGQWNSGGGMVDWMYKQLDHVYQEPESNREALVADVFAFAVAFVYEAVSAHATKDDPADLEADLTNLADDLTQFLLGVQGNFADRLFL